MLNEINRCKSSIVLKTKSDLFVSRRAVAFADENFGESKDEINSSYGELKI